MPLTPLPTRAPLAPNRNIDRQDQSLLFQLPNELLVDIFRRASPVEMARLEQTSRGVGALIKPLWKGRYGAGPIHRLPTHEEGDYKKLVQEKLDLSRRPPTDNSAEELLEDGLHAIMGFDDKICATFAEIALVYLQKHRQRGEAFWHETCATCLVMQGRWAEAETHYDAVIELNGSLAKTTYIVMARFSWPLKIAPPAWSSLSGLDRFHVILATIAGHHNDKLRVLMTYQDDEYNTYIEYNFAARIAARFNNIEALQMLVRAGADVVSAPTEYQDLSMNCRGAIWEAAHAGHVPIIEYLLAQGGHADSIRESFGATSALDEAIHQNHLDVTSQLMAALPQYRRNMSQGHLRLGLLLGRSASSASSPKRLEMLRALVEVWHIPINLLDHEQKSFLHLAAQKGDVELIELALELGANPQLKDDTGQTAYEYAVSGRLQAAARMLLSHNEEASLLTPTYQAKAQAAHQIDRALSRRLQYAFADLFNDRRRSDNIRRHNYPSSNFGQRYASPALRRALYVDSFSHDTLQIWASNIEGHTALRFVSELSNTMHAIAFIEPTLHDEIDVSPQQRMQILALLDTWVAPRNTLSDQQKSALIRAILHKASVTLLVEIRLLAQTPFGVLLAAGMRRKFATEMNIARSRASA